MDSRIIMPNTSGLPIYERVKEQIKAAILSDELSEGDMLPSTNYDCHMHSRPDT